MSYVNEKELRKAIEQVHPNGDLFEVRIINKLGKKNMVLSGYFKDADTLLMKLKTVNLENANVYFTLNQLNEGLFSRQQSETFINGANTTSDNDVDGLNWLFIDLDPKRSAGISSSNEEMQIAYGLASKIYEYLKNLGFEEPVKAVSGNGAHLLYRIKLKNTDINRALVEKCLKTLSVLFDNDKIAVDTANFNPARICKLYGTLAQKGKNTETRPHRMSYVVGDIKPIKATDRKYLEKLVNELPQDPPRPAKYNNYSPTEFNVEEWLDRYGLRYEKKPFHDGTKYVLDECPFDSSHKSPDSMVTVAASGAIGFKCLHNSCANKRWQDLRLKFEPNAYEHSDEDRRIDEGYLRHNREREIKIVPKAEVTEPRFMNAKMIFEVDEPEGEYIKSGINVIDHKLKGLQKGCVTLISGLRGAAKSTILGQIILNCVEHKQTAVVYSGELSKKRFLNWMMIQAAGKGYTEKFREYEGYYCRDDVKPSICSWLGDYMWLYNNTCGNKFDEIATLLREKVAEVKADICIIDNLMALDLGNHDKDQYAAQTDFVWSLKAIASELNVHVIFVAHPRKAMGFLRLDDISGSGNITNIVDNAFIIHRNNNDFKRLTKSMFNWKDDNEVYDGTNVIEICKDRENGNQDIFIPLWYEAESKRLKNYDTENIVYSWEKPKPTIPEGFIQVTDEMMESIPF